jgi:Glyoxalase-like domain
VVATSGRSSKAGLEEDAVTAKQAFPRLRQVVLDCTDARTLAEFYRRLLGLQYRPGDEPPPAGEADVNGHDDLPTGGQEISPLADVKTPRRRT